LPYLAAIPQFQNRLMESVIRLASPAPRPVVIPGVHGVFKGLIKSLVKANLTFEIIVSINEKARNDPGLYGSLSWPGALKYFGCDDCLTLSRRSLQ
jgi:hypothetical protein